MKHALEAGVTEDEIEDAAGWANTKDGLKSQYLRQKLSE